MPWEEVHERRERGKTSRHRPDLARSHAAGAGRPQYEAYNYEVGIKPLIEKAMEVQTFRVDRADETEFMTISYWESRESMSSFGGDDPTQIHHLERDAECLIELPESVQILEIRASHGNTGGES